MVYKPTNVTGGATNLVRIIKCRTLYHIIIWLNNAGIIIYNSIKTMISNYMIILIVNRKPKSL